MRTGRSEPTAAPAFRRLEMATERFNAYLRLRPTATMQDPHLVALWEDREFATELLENERARTPESD